MIVSHYITVQFSPKHLTSEQYTTLSVERTYFQFSPFPETSGEVKLKWNFIINQFQIPIASILSTYLKNITLYEYFQFFDEILERTARGLSYFTFHHLIFFDHYT